MKAYKRQAIQKCEMPKYKPLFAICNINVYTILSPYVHEPRSAPGPASTRASVRTQSAPAR